jgi:hypothetical protein
MSGAKAGYNYRLLLIGRDYDEILASQVKMIDRSEEIGLFRAENSLRPRARS